MKITFHADKNSKESEKFTVDQISKIESTLERFSEIITHLEAHLSNEDAAGNGLNTKQCKLLVHTKQRKPIEVTDNADRYETAISGALQKLTASLDDFG
jgi:hypothetical protein